MCCFLQLSFNFLPYSLYVNYKNHLGIWITSQKATTLTSPPTINQNLSISQLSTTPILTSYTSTTSLANADTLSTVSLASEQGMRRFHDRSSSYQENNSFENSISNKSISASSHAFQNFDSVKMDHIKLENRSSCPTVKSQPRLSSAEGMVLRPLNFSTGKNKSCCTTPDKPPLGTLQEQIDKCSMQSIF